MLLRGNLGACCLLLGALAAPAADSRIEPVTVCEALQDPAAHEGKTLALLGRFSFRKDGRTLNEESCGDKPPAGDAAPQPNSVRLVADVKQGPKPPEVFALDAAAVTRKLKQVKEHTALHAFRFGTVDYDRWAVVYGRLEIEKGKSAANVRLVYRGDGVVLFLHE